VHKRSKLRQIAKKIWPLYWFAGLARYVRFTMNLRKENRAYALQMNPVSPPPMFRYRVHGALGETGYVEVGKFIAACITKCLENHGVAFENSTILDFACGPGRIASELKKIVPSCHLYGSDIDREAIHWAQKYLPCVANFTTNEPSPPTQYADDHFDVIYNISLFTHLDETSQNVWLAELARILKPHGTLVTTIHGRFTLASCTANELKELNDRGIMYRIGRKGRFKLDGLPDFYQTTFHTREYIARVWSRFFEVVDHIEGGLGGSHDLVVLRRRSQLP
jgi:2-polyprenyl-3-methyl-5-hydroxy-6-metoxy-1,4-benzoquinol methylase